MDPVQYTLDQLVKNINLIFVANMTRSMYMLRIDSGRGITSFCLAQV